MKNEILTPNDSAVRGDRATQLALMLARELWTVKDRLVILESVLSKEGVSLPNIIDRHMLSADEKKLLDADRARFVAEIVAALEKPGDRQR
ncbi:MAG: hypothetical protein EXR88_02795 [Gammaproteobacteria bacterium]|nr:hypothetical protein [Gammaproteobacteria bacterium]